MRIKLSQLLVASFVLCCVSVCNGFQDKTNRFVPVNTRSNILLNKDHFKVECWIYTSEKLIHEKCLRDVSGRLKPVGRFRTIQPKPVSLDSIPFEQPLKTRTLLPAHVAILGDSEAEAVRAFFKKSSTAQIVLAPKGGCTPNKPFYVKDTVNRNFVTDVNRIVGKDKKQAFAPVIESFPEGSEFRVCCIKKGGKFEADVSILFSSIVNVETHDWIGSRKNHGSKENVTVQCPRSENLGFRVKESFTDGDWIMIDPGFEKQTTETKVQGTGLFKQKVFQKKESRFLYLMKISEKKSKE